MKNKMLSFAVLTALLAGIAAGYLFVERSGSVPAERDEETRLSVVATFYPLRYFAESVGGDAVDVRSIVPAGVEPHDYEPTPRDIASAYRADVFLLNGAGIDAWAEKIRPELEQRGVTVVQMSEIVNLLPGAVSGGGAQGVYDPHFWLDPVWAAREAEAIRDALAQRDPTRAPAFTRNTEELSALLVDLDRAYREGLRGCVHQTIVTSHDAFAYLAMRYGFEAIAITGTSPEAEVSPRALAGIAETVRDLGLRYVFFETLSDPKAAETLAREISAETLAFDPIEGLADAERRSGKDYAGIMRDNLSNLRTALECQT